MFSVCRFPRNEGRGRWTFVLTFSGDRGCRKGERATGRIRERESTCRILLCSKLKRMRGMRVRHHMFGVLYQLL